jgi:integrase
LAAAVPTVASWKLASLPRAVDAEVVARLLECCDRGTVTGRRDYAILVVLARLGLRAGEVAALDLGDVDWRAGEVTVRGKGSRYERLPVPVDVGEALVASLGDRSRGGTCRALFMGIYAPRGRMSAHSVGWVVRAACDRAGVPRVSAHRLRHSVATSLLADGAPLAEIADLLRHRRLLTTAIYAKVDRRALRAVALPWPGGAA